MRIPIFFIFAKVVFASKREGNQYLYNCGLGAENRALSALAKVQLPVKVKVKSSRAVTSKFLITWGT